MAVNTDNVRKWVDALRSGEYDQTSGGLRRVDADGNATGFCCLGVACEISGLGRWSDNGMSYVADEYRSASYMPGPVRDWLGLDSDDPLLNDVKYDDTPFTASASELNDTYDRSFGDIADAIEATFLS